MSAPVPAPAPVPVPVPILVTAPAPATPTPTPVDYPKALAEFIDICNTGISEYKTVWQDHSIRALVLKCAVTLRVLALKSAPPGFAKGIEALVREDLHFFSESLQAKQGGIYTEFLEVAANTGKRGPIPKEDEFAQVIERIRGRHAEITAQLDSIQEMIRVNCSPEREKELRADLQELIEKFQAQSGFDPVVLERLVSFQTGLV